MELKEYEPEELASSIGKNELRLIDVREPEEFLYEKIDGAESIPLSKFSPEELQNQTLPLVLYCQSGNRSTRAAGILMDAGIRNVGHLRGGLTAWKKSGYNVEKKKGAFPVMRQVQIVAGSLVFLGVAAGATLHPGFYLISAFVGCGLIFAGATGWCGMAVLLEKMPWNESSSCSSGKSCHSK